MNNSIPNFNWTSETNMIKQFLQNGYTDIQIEELFKQHRDNYLLNPANGINSLNDNFV